MSANLALRFLLELAGIGALAYWGWQAAEPPARLVVALGAPVALIVAWAFVVAPKARNRIPQTGRMLVGTGLLLVAAGSLGLSGQPLIGVALALAVVGNAAVLLRPGMRGEG